MPEPAQAALRQAGALIDVRRYQDAIGLLNQVIASEPASGRPRCLLAQCRLGLGDHAGALDAATGAASVDPENAWAHRLRSIALLKLKRTKESLAAAAEAVRLSPQEASNYLVLTDAALAARHWQAAGVAAGRAVELAPNSANGHNALGLVALRRVRYGQAEGHFRTALGLDPQNARAMNNLGVALVRQGRRPQAIHYFAEAGRLDPRLPMPRKNAVSAAKFGTTAIICVAAVQVVRILGGGLNAASMSLVLVVVAAAGAIVVLRRRLPHGGVQTKNNRQHRDTGDPKASKELMRELRRERPVVRASVIYRMVGGSVLVLTGASLTVAGVETIGRQPVGASAALTVGIACFVALAYLIRRARRGGRRR